MRSWTRPRPGSVIALNASREYTRGVSLAATLAHWRAAAARLPEDCIVLVNVDDPLVVWAFEPAPHVVGVAGGLGWREDAALCPACGAAHDWAGSTWSCPGCGRTRPEPAWSVIGSTGGGWSIAHPNGTVEVQVAVPGRTGPVGAAFALAAARHGRRRRRARRGGPEQCGRRGRSVRAIPCRGPSRAPAHAEEPRRMGRGHRRRGLRGAAARDRRGPVRAQGHHHHVGGPLRTPGRSRTIPVTGGRSADALAVLDAAGVAGVEVPDAAQAVAEVSVAGAEVDEVVVACNYPAFRRLSRQFRAGGP